MNHHQSWFSALVIFESRREGGLPSDQLFEQRIVIVTADTLEHAVKKAKSTSIMENVEYRNANGERVRWLFREVLDIKPLLDQTIGDGSEVYYAFLVGDELDSLRRLIQSPANRPEAAAASSDA